MLCNIFQLLEKDSIRCHVISDSSKVGLFLQPWRDLDVHVQRFHYFDHEAVAAGNHGSSVCTLLYKVAQNKVQHTNRTLDSCP